MGAPRFVFSKKVKLKLRPRTTKKRHAISFGRGHGTFTPEVDGSCTSREEVRLIVIWFGQRVGFGGVRRRTTLSKFERES